MSLSRERVSEGGAVSVWLLSRLHDADVEGAPCARRTDSFLPDWMRMCLDDLAKLTEAFGLDPEGQQKESR